MFTLKQVIDFCYENRGTKAFAGFTYEQVTLEVLYAADKNRLTYVWDYQGICGVCLYTVNQHAKALYICQIVAKRNGFVTLVIEARKRFPGFIIEGRRGKKLVRYKRLWATTHQA